MASTGIPLTLAVEIEATEPTARPGRPPAVDRRDGPSESHVGGRADCVGTARHTRGSRVAAGRAAVYAVESWIETRASRRGRPSYRITRGRCWPATSS